MRRRYSCLSNQNLTSWWTYAFSSGPLSYCVSVCLQDRKIEELRQSLARYKKVQEMVMSVQGKKGEYPHYSSCGYTVKAWTCGWVISYHVIEKTKQNCQIKNAQLFVSQNWHEDFFVMTKSCILLTIWLHSISIVICAFVNLGILGNMSWQIQDKSMKQIKSICVSTYAYILQWLAKTISALGLFCKLCWSPPPPWLFTSDKVKDGENDGSHSDSSGSVSTALSVAMEAEKLALAGMEEAAGQGQDEVWPPTHSHSLTLFPRMSLVAVRQV